jgi:hypothetical protein
MSTKRFSAAVGIAAAVLLLDLPARAAAPPTQAAADEDAARSARTSRAGALVGPGVPSIVSAQALVKFDGLVGVAAEGGFLPTVGVPIADDATFQQWMIDAAVRIYPFRNAVFLGCALGMQRIEATATTSAQGSTATAGVVTKTLFVMPQIGFVHRFRSGFSIGMDVGVELPVSGTTALTSTANGNVVEPPQEVADAMRFVEKAPIPVLHLLQLGYMF